MAQFKTIHTTLGLQRMAQAESTGRAINLTAMAVGDGNGVAVTPTEGQTQLARERFRAAPNRVFNDPTNNNKFTAELLVPASAGGFTIREVGIFDADGTLFAVGNLPDTYKPVVTDGAFGDTVVRMEFLVTNATVVTLQINPNVAVATQTWVSNNVTAATLLKGGTTGQLPFKNSNADGDIIWQDPTNVNVVVNTIEEIQTLAANQTQVDLATTSTRGLALYVVIDPAVGGVRLRSNQWTPDAVIKTRLVLAQSYAAGTKLIAVQNEPAGSAPNPLIQSRNLSDVADKAASRKNLDVPSTTEAAQRMPASGISYFPLTVAPAGWLKANGAAVSRTAYADLFAAIGTTFGAGDGFTTFNVPDLRGEFIRGWDDGRGLDANRSINSVQGDQFRSHGHTGSTDGQGDHAHGGWTDVQGWHGHSGATSWNGDHQHDSGWGESSGGPYGNARGPGAQGSGDTDTDNYSYLTSVAGGHNHTLFIDGNGNHNHNIQTYNGGTHAHNVTVAANGGTETRPRNFALLACIKY